MSWLIDPATRVLTTALDGYAVREQAIAANLANIDTPGYHSVSSSFESELAAAVAGDGTATLDMIAPQDGPSAGTGMLATTDGHLKGATVRSSTSPSAALDQQGDGVASRLDGNGVDLESEMTALAETQLKYSAVSRLLTGKIGMLRDVVMAR
jgi:flagellar basal-body rod protein FlgB